MRSALAGRRPRLREHPTVRGMSFYTVFTISSLTAWQAVVRIHRCAALRRWHHPVCRLSACARHDACIFEKKPNVDLRPQSLHKHPKNLPILGHTYAINGLTPHLDTYTHTRPLSS